MNKKDMRLGNIQNKIIEMLTFIRIFKRKIEFWASSKQKSNSPWVDEHFIVLTLKWCGVRTNTFQISWKIETTHADLPSFVLVQV